MVVFPGVGRDVEPVFAQEAGRLAGGADGQRVDDARPRKVIQVLGKPGEPLVRSGQANDRQVQALAIQRPAQDQRLALHDAMAKGQLLGHIASHRAFAVAVVASTGTPGGSSASSVRSRR